MAAVTTEELLSLVRAVAQGQESMERVLPALEDVEQEMRHKWERFLLHATEDVEMPQATREEIAGALEEYIDFLGQMKEAGTENELADLADQAESSVMALRAAQDAHRDYLASGPTLFPYLNRLLMQYEAVREGADSPRLLVLLREGGSFIQGLRVELGSRDVTPEQTQPVFHLQQLLQALEQAVEAQGALPEIDEDLIELAHHLAGLLAEPQLEGDSGPTPIPAINQVLDTLSGLSGSIEEFQFLLSAIGECRNFLRAANPLNSGPEVMEKLRPVLQSLDQMESCLTEQSDFEQLVEAATQLEVAGNALAQAVSGDQPSRDFAPETEGLPPMLRSVLEPGFLFLDGQAEAELVFEASDHLEGVVSDMQSEASRIQGDERLAALQEALQLMGESSEMLRELAASGNPKLLEYSLELCFQAAEHLQQAGMR